MDSQELIASSFEALLLNKVRTIGFKEIKNIVDNNPCFWLPLNDYIKKTIKKSY